MESRSFIKDLKTRDLPYIVLLFLCCIIAYWPLSFFIFSVKNDALNYFLPVRYQVSDAISNGYWPFWSPYFNLGYPLHGDMQSGVWNPFVQFLSLFGPYTLRTLHYETLLYVFLAGLGMFYLLKHFAFDKKICLLIAVSYMLCGYNSDSAQFLNWISTSSFLPFVVLFSYRAIKENSLQASIYCGFFIYVFFSTAYPADFIILIYLMLVFFAWHIYQTKSYVKTNLLFLLKKLLIIASVFIILSLPAILSYWQSLPLTERGSGVSYSDAMSNPLHPLLFISYITPLCVWKTPFVGITDPLERNSYIGLISFAFLICGFFLKSNLGWVKFCKWGFVIAAIFSLGEIGGIRPLSYFTLPLMNTFRHPANARIFTIFFASNIAAFAIQQLNALFKKKLLTYSSVSILLVLFCLLAWGGFKNINLFKLHFSPNSSFTNNVKQFLTATSFADMLVLEIFIQLPFLLILFLFSTRKISFKTLFYAGIINCVIHSILFMPFTVVKNERAGTIQKILAKETKDAYPLPALNSSIFENSKDGIRLFKEIGALNMYNKKIGRIDYRITPANLIMQNMFWNTNPKLRDFLIHYPLLYKADTLLLLKDSATAYNFGKRKICFVADTNLIRPNDYAGLSTGHKLIAKEFKPDYWKIIVSSDRPGFYCLFQNYYPNWKLFVDGKEQQIFPCNVSFMGFKMQKGIHSISFRYQATEIKTAFFINLVALLSLVVFFIIGLYKKNEEKNSFSSP